VPGIRLFHVPGTRSTRVLWLLEELGEPYELELMRPEERKSPEHLERHPLGRVPAIEEDGGYVFESAAICLHVADLHPEAGLIPPVGSHERALVYQWVLFAMTELETNLIESRSSTESDPERASSAAARFLEAAGVVEKALEGREYLVGDRFTVADLTVSGVLAFARRLEVLKDSPALDAYLARIAARPARARALAVRLDS
jgi:glutathione S-transferase